MDLPPIAQDASLLLASSRTPVPGLADRQRAFLDVLGRQHAPAASGADGAPGARDPDRARKAAEQFIASTFLMPILKEIRAQNRAAPPFGPTQAEKALGPLMDAQLADRIVRSSQFGLVDRVADQLRGVASRAVDPPL